MTSCKDRNRKAILSRIPKENLWGKEGVCGGCPYQDSCPAYKTLFEWVEVYPGLDDGVFTGGQKYEQVRMFDTCPVVEARG